MLGKKKGKVFVGLSGGVDSAVSAALLAKEGYDVTGVFIRIALPGYPCKTGEDKIEAMRVAAHLEIPFLELDLSKEYKEEVFANTIGEYKKGRTPNPDALCNRQIKFGAFYDFARAHEAEYIATGHYARVVLQNSPLRRDKQAPDSSAESFVSLLSGTDTEKDQSYFLWAVPQEVLARTLFPVGGLHKKEVRALAEKFCLPNAQRRDSQGLCFLGDISIEDMLQKELAPKPGEVLDEKGQVVGSHEGAMLYTLGQRHGFTLFAQSPQTPSHFVIGKDIGRNTITVSTERFPGGARTTKIRLREVNWIGTAPAGEVSARYRYRQKLVAAKIEGDVVMLAEPHWVPEGQSLVLYQGERCLGGGVVDTAGPV